MFEFEYKKPLATIDGVEYEIFSYDISAPNSVMVMLRNEQYNWVTSAIVDETKINGVLQTSVDMILDTLANG